MSNVDTHFIRIIAQTLETGNQEIITATLSLFTDHFFPLDLCQEYQIEELIEKHAPQNDQASKLTEKIEEQQKKWQEFTDWAIDLKRGVSEEKLSRILEFLDAPDKRMQVFTVRALNRLGIVLVSQGMHGIEQRLLKMEPCEPVTQMLAKIAGARAANRTVQEIFDEWSERCVRSGTTLEEVFVKRQWHLQKDFRTQEEKDAEEHELRSLTGFLPHHPNVFVDKDGKEIAPKKSNTQHRQRHHPYARPEPVWRV
uniref:Uncharacterized protein n=1 Tax=Caenorhabditis japonica TaxID=281687 RepID=A0A8R1DR63_CAEJA